ncbi:MAG: MAP kinase phosphatase 6 [Monoraphidium minutum]|nr:MAG: MAP kinase phosphatase 6 [Monoraphidium minutum]
MASMGLRGQPAAVHARGSSSRTVTVKAFSLGAGCRSSVAAAQAQQAAAHAAPLAQHARGCRSKLRCRAQQVETAQAAAAAQAPVRPQLPPLDDGYEAAVAFASYGNWLLPGSLMAGRYPYIERSRCASHEQGEAQLEAIVAAGARVFVCLQAEVPPQREMRIGGVDGFLPYKAVVELIAASQTPPPPMEVVNGLRNPKLDQFLPQRKRAAAPEVVDYYQREEVEFAHCPIVDLGVPSMQQLKEIVSDLQRRLEAGQKVYLHCWGGRGRAGTVGACLLAQMYGLSADEALERVQRSYATRRDTYLLSPETDEQKQLVRDFVAQLGAQ